MPEEGLDSGWHWVKSYEKKSPIYAKFLFLLRLFFPADKDVICGWLVVSMLWSHSCLASSVPRKLHPSSGVHILKDENEYTVCLDGEWMQENLSDDFRM